MLGAPIDAWYVWLGVSLASLAVLGVAATAIPAPPSEAPALAETVDTVAASGPPASARHPIDAERLHVEPRRLTVEGPERRSAVLQYGPVTPAQPGTGLRAVALGDPPSAHFRDPAAFASAASDARAAPRTVEPVDEVTVRAVAWEDVSVTLVAG